MAWLCLVLRPLAPHADAMATAAFAALVILGLVHFIAVLPAVYAYQRKIYGAKVGYNLNWLSTSDLREAGLGWAVTFRRAAVSIIVLLFAPVALWPTLCT